MTRRTLLHRMAAWAVVAPVPSAMLGQIADGAKRPPFEEVTAAQSGIHWTHTAGKSKDKHLPETSGAGCAFLDFDQDGWMDIYLVNSGKADFYSPTVPLKNALYRNNRDGTFTDVTLQAGVAGGGYGMGVAVGDFNGDGYPDLYVTQVGRNILYRNNGDGTFTDVTEKAGVGAGGWSSSAVWFDYDNDGRLDLFVCQFAEFDREIGLWEGCCRGSPLLYTAHLQAPAELALSQQWRRHLHRCQQDVGDSRSPGEGVERGSGGFEW